MSKKSRRPLIRAQEAAKVSTSNRILPYTALTATVAVVLDNKLLHPSGRQLLHLGERLVVHPEVAYPEVRWAKLAPTHREELEQ